MNFAISSIEFCQCSFDKGLVQPPAGALARGERRAGVHRRLYRAGGRGASVVRAALMGGLTRLLAESGYAPANPPEWIEKLRPDVVLLSVAAGDREGRPDTEMLQAVGGYTLLRTDRNGWIKLSTDGERMWVHVERR